MKTANILKTIALASITTLGLALTSQVKADQPTEPLENIKLFGVVNTTDNNRQVAQLQPSSSSITEQRNDGLTVLTLSQTFVNNGSDTINGYYHVPLPNPAALLNYQVLSDKSAEQMNDPQKLKLNQGESITYQVRYELATQQLVGFHQTGSFGIDETLKATNIAQN